MSPLSKKHFDPDKDVPDLKGKVFIVTGGSAGIGFGIVAHLLQHGAAKIVLLSNKEEHATEAIKELKDWGDVSVVNWRQCDLADLKQTHEVAKQLKAELKQIDALVCNAGLGVGKYWETKDGLDSHFQINHLSQMLLTMVLLPNLLTTPNARIVFQSSEFHRGAPSSTRFASREEINQDIGPSNLYSRTKLAQVCFARALQRRIDASQYRPAEAGQEPPAIHVLATHPGAVATPQQEQAIDAYGTAGKVGVALVRPFMKDAIKQGCRSALFAATGEDVVRENITAAYVMPDREVTAPSKQAQDESLGERLWVLSEELLKSTLGDVPY